MVTSGGRDWDRWARLHLSQKPLVYLREQGVEFFFHVHVRLIFVARAIIIILIIIATGESATSLGSVST
jgi:hypothetical protein